MASNSSKRYKGQIQVLDGSHVGEAVVICKFSNNSVGLTQYMGEAKSGSKEYDHKFYLQKLIYDDICEVSCILVACNIISTGADTVSVDTTSNPGFVKITITNGSFQEVCEPGRDRIKINTPSNKWSSIIDQKLSDTEILVSFTPQEKALPIDETATPIAQEDLLITLESEETKDFSKRRWDLRDLYIYA